MGREMAELFFDKLMGFLGVDIKPQEDQRDPLATSDPQFGYRDYTPAERAQEVVTGSLDTAGSMLRGMGKAAIEAPRDIYALGSAIGKIQDRSRNRLDDVGPVKSIGELFTEAYREAPSFLPDEATAERILPEMTPMSRTYSQDSSVYNLPEEFGRIAAPLPLLDYARPSQIAKLGKAAEITPRILDARNPETGRTGFTSSGSQVPALEPLREPTRQGRFRTQYEDTNIPVDPQFAEQQLAKTDDELLADLRGRTNHASLVGDLQDKYFQEAPRNLPDGTHIAPSVRMQWAYKQAEQELLRKHKAELQDRLIMPSQERQSYIGGKPTPRILQEEAPQVEKLPPMLREPTQQARIFNEDGGTGSYSRVEQALLDIKNDPNVPASVTPRSLMQRLESMGVTRADIEEHGLNLDSITRKNKHGHDVVDIQKVFDEVEPPQDRMSRVILDEMGGGDADEMDLSGRQGRGEFNIADFWENEGQYRMDDWLYDYMGDIENDYNRLGRELSPNTFDQQGSQTDEILEAIADRLKMTSQAKTDEEAVLMAYDKLNAAIDQGDDWLGDLDAELGGGIQSKAEETIISREQEFYNENPYIDDTIDFAGEEFKIFGNDDVGYRAWHNGNVIVDDVYDLNELEVRIQNWSMDQGYFGHGTGQGAMQWSQYLQGDSDYYTPLEEVILTYDPQSGRTFESSHYGSDVAEGYVSHMRTTARETESGASVYHVDEIQSDLHQAGRQTGYGTEKERETVRTALAEELQANRAIDEAKASYTEAGSLDNEVMGLLNILDRKYGYNTPAMGERAVERLARKSLDDLDIDASHIDYEVDQMPEEFQNYFNAWKDKSKANDKRTTLESDLNDKPSDETPLKDERWIKAMVRQAMERAVSKGNFDGITFSNPQNQINQWSDRYAKLYKEVYENKLKSILETIGKEYGVKPRKVKLNDPEMQDAGENWYLPLSRDMMETIKKRGVPLASAVGTTPMILDRINKEREDKTPRILRTA